MTGDDQKATDLAVGAAPPAARPALAALFALDRRLEQLARRTRDPLLAEMRLTWWYEALIALDVRDPPAEPVLRDLAATVLHAGVPSSTLAAIATGWELLLAERPLGDEALRRFAERRGATLFRAAATILGGTLPMVDPAGEAWALADFAGSAVAPDERQAASELAAGRLRSALAVRWPGRLRPLGLLALLASRGGTTSPVREAARALRFRLIGR